ncbi:hypothetical protein KIK06_16190 [Nocardiopsis sp. EMB25]|uniref:DUF7691 family protein n=1 Tax=Nocardiopsis TaxID=2013 RepID=UPI001F4D14C3|nr:MULTISPECIES: hypothetical protein [Nocardiopsis]MCY9785426.1 hypothetical protein [Nocardiopsis sp. EMB25]
MSSGLMAYSVDLGALPDDYTRAHCDAYGSFLDNRPFYPVKYWWFAEVDQALKELGVTAVRMDSLWTGGGAGEEWFAGQVREAAEQAAGISAERVNALEDYSMRESVHAVLEWIRYAAARGHGIVGFYH